MLLVLAPAGLLFGGWLAERLAKRGIADANQRVVVWASLAHIPFAASFALVPNPWVALVFASLNTCVIGIGTGPQNAAFQAIVPNNMRAKITATFLFMFTMARPSARCSWATSRPMYSATRTSCAIRWR